MDSGWHIELLESSEDSQFADIRARIDDSSAARSPSHLSFTLRACHASVWVAYNDATPHSFVVTQRWGSLLACVDFAGDDIALTSGATRKLFETIVAEAPDECDVVGLQLPAGGPDVIHAVLGAGFALVEPQCILMRSCHDYAPHESPQQSRSLPIVCEDVFGAGVIGGALEDFDIGAHVAVGNEVGCPQSILCLETVSRHVSPEGPDTALVIHGVMPRCADVSRMERFVMTNVATKMPSAERVMMAMNSAYGREVSQLCARGWRVVRVSLRVVSQASVSRYRQLLRLPQVDVGNWQL